jgi:hypothetical protein
VRKKIDISPPSRILYRRNWSALGGRGANDRKSNNLSWFPNEIGLCEWVDFAVLRDSGLY